MKKTTKTLLLSLALGLGLSACAATDLNKNNSVSVDDGVALIQIKSFIFQTNISIVNNNNIELYNSDNFKELDNYIYVSLSKFNISKNQITIIHNISNISIKVIGVSQNQIEQLTEFKIKFEKLLEQSYDGGIEINNKNESNVLLFGVSAGLYNPSSWGFSHTTSGKTHKDIDIFVEFFIDENNNIIQKIHGIMSVNNNNDYYINLSIPFKNDQEQVYQLESGLVLKTKIHQYNN